MKKLIFLMIFIFLLNGCSPKVIEHKNSNTKIQNTEKKEEKKEETPNFTEKEILLLKSIKDEVIYYAKTNYYSKNRIINLLTDSNSEKVYPLKLVEYILKNSKLDFKKNALSTASIYAYDLWYDKDKIKKELENDLFTKEEIDYAMKNLKNVKY